jgi:pimeloyl-ACP methyl ester carboxylesterase
MQRALPIAVPSRAALVRLVCRLAVVLACGLPLAARAASCSSDGCDECRLCSGPLRCCHEAPEFWIINTRGVPKCADLDAGFERIRYDRWEPRQGRFVRSSRESFLAEESTMPTLFFVHGNTLQHDGAVKSAWELHERLRCCPGPKRLVLWSWPAQIAITRPLIRPRQLIDKNLKIKFVYAEYQGYYMAKLVDQMSLSQRVTLSGHSYGGITAAVALHYLGGGTLRGLQLAGGAPTERANLRAAVISGAFDNDAMDLQGAYGRAFVAAEKVYNTRNGRDKTLDRWPDISLRGRMAIGVTGINAARLGEYRSKLCQQTLTSDVGRSHYMGPHLESNKFVASLCCIAFGRQRFDSGPIVATPSAVDAPLGASATPADGAPAPVEQGAAETTPGDLAANRAPEQPALHAAAP